MLTSKDIPSLRIAFRARFSEFQSTEDAVVDLAIEEALLIHGIRRLVTLYLAAHILATQNQAGRAGPSGVTGPIKGATSGPFKTSYATLVSDGDIKGELARTKYGARALLLEKRTPRCAIGAIVAGVA